MEICVWPRGDYILENLLPQILPLPDNEVILDLLQELAPGRPDEIIDKTTWSLACQYVDIPPKTAIAVYENVFRRSSEPRVSTLCLDLLLLSFRPQKSQEYSRDDLVAEFFHNNMTTILRILFLDSPKAPDDLISGLDYVFEGMIESRPERISRIIRMMWYDVIEDRLQILAKRMSSCLIPDPFRICQQHEPSTSLVALRKKTSLAPRGRRVVSIIGWKRLQLLTKEVYRDAHLRLYNPGETPSPIYCPGFSLSVMVENVADCPCILLGPCRGTVHLRNLRNCSITVACGRLLVEEVENCVIFVAARLSPVILSSESVQFAPFNCCYTGFWEELKLARGELPGHYLPEKEDDRWRPLPPWRFYIQPVPIVCEDLDSQEFLSFLPEKYRRTVEKQPTTPKIEDENESPLRTSDIIYLKSKIEEK